MSLVKRIAASRPVQKAVGVVAAEYLRLVWATTGFVMEPHDFFDRADLDVPFIVGKWHGQHFLMPFIRTLLRSAPAAKVLVSRHRDGEINAIVAEHLGIGTIRASGAHGAEFTRKGGVSGFRQMLAALAQGICVSLTADVPKVSRRAGRGIVQLAAKSGRPIYLVAIATKNRITLDNWDHTEIALPFGHGGIAGRGPFRIPADADDDALEHARRTIESELESATVRAHELADRKRGGAARG
jgi:lysophospholipid acyltransferase (LPLAT)-like uncharacterized protein